MRWPSSTAMVTIWRVEDLAQTIATADRFQVPYTTYLMMQDHPKVEPAYESALRQQGHDFGQHAFAGAKPSLEEMRSGLRAEMDAFRTRYGHESVTYRGHSVIWVGWTEMAKYLRENEVRLDTNFAPGRFHHAGYVNGSGLPVKFMDEDGRLLDIYEQTTMSTDDGWTADKIFATPLSVEECIALSKEQADAAIEQFHTVYHPYFHPLRTRAGPTSSQQWLEGVLGYCREREFHFVSGVDWVNFNDGRRSLQLTAYEFDPESLSLRFTLEAGARRKCAVPRVAPRVSRRAYAKRQIEWGACCHTRLRTGRQAAGAPSRRLCGRQAIYVGNPMGCWHLLGAIAVTRLGLEPRTP